jgi:hypothetical protein
MAVRDLAVGFAGPFGTAVSTAADGVSGARRVADGCSNRALSGFAVASERAPSATDAKLDG